VRRNNTLPFLPRCYSALVFIHHTGTTDIGGTIWPIPSQERGGTDSPNNNQIKLSTNNWQCFGNVRRGKVLKRIFVSIFNWSAHINIEEKRNTTSTFKGRGRNKTKRLVKFNGLNRRKRNLTNLTESVRSHKKLILLLWF